MTATQDQVALARKLIGLVDNTTLDLEKDTDAVIDKLIESSIKEEPHTAAICIYPKFIKHAKSTRLPIPVATVVNFPSGEASIEEMVKETKQAVADGADEVDMVINYKRVLADGDVGVLNVYKQVKAVRDVCPSPVLVKVILETGELKDSDLIERCSNEALRGGADFLKTSTGKVAVNATLEAARVMLGCIRKWREAYPESQVGFKAAGGIRTYEDAVEYYKLATEIMGRGWVEPRTMRIGASSLVKNLRDIITPAAA